MTPYAAISTDRVLVQAMKTAEMNHRVIANNIVNADTPHYSPTQMDFQKTLTAALEGRGEIALRATRPRHFDFRTAHPKFERIAFLSKNDYNKVDLDQEVARLAENRSRYETYARLMAKRFEMTKGMIQSLNR